jgi:hypothetical protein
LNPAEADALLEKHAGFLRKILDKEH